MVKVERELVSRKLVGCALQEVVEPVAYHEGRELLCYRFVLHVQIVQHIIRVPMSDQFNDVDVDAGAEEGNGACGPEIDGIYVAVLESEARSEEHDGGI